MERFAQLQFEIRPEGASLATSDDALGLVAQGLTNQNAIGISREFARKLLNVQAAP